MIFVLALVSSVSSHNVWVEKRTCDEGVAAVSVVPHQGEEGLPGHKRAEQQRLNDLQRGNTVPEQQESENA